MMKIIPPPPPGWNSWEELMNLAMAEADKAEQAGEVPVGAIVVSQDGEILGQGYNSPILDNDPSAHAEIVAIRSACQKVHNYRLDGAILVVTLEPCQMCAGAIIHSRLAGVVYGAADPKAGAVDSCFDGLEQSFHNHTVWYMSGISADKCSKQLATFFRRKDSRQLFLLTQNENKKARR